MERDYDLINELGYMNWIDDVAGEAVVLGALTKNLELEGKGADLARLVRSIRYDSDGFYKVEAAAKLLEAEIELVKSKEIKTVYIEEICMGKEGAKEADDEWEFDFILVEGRYEIRMMLPTYRGKEKLMDKVKQGVESEVWSLVSNNKVTALEKRVDRQEFNGQEYITTYYLDGEKLVRRTIDHQHDPADHEGRGYLDIFYFDDYGLAQQAWNEVRLITSDQKR